MEARRFLAAETTAAVAALATVGAMDGLTVPVLSQFDQIGIDPTPAVDEGGVGGRDAIRRRFTGAQRHGQVRRHVVHHAHLFRQVDDVLHADRLGQTHGHDVARQLQAATQALRAVELAAVVLRRPGATAGAAGEADRRIQNDRGRGEVAFQRRRIDEGLVGRTGLAAGLGRAVEAGQGVGIAADHRQDAARLRLDGDQGAVDGRHLLQGELAALALDEDQIAALQRATPGVGPGHVGRAQRARLIVLGRADPDGASADVFDCGRLPRTALGRSRALLGLGLPTFGEIGRAPGAAPAVTTVVVLKPAHQGVARRRLQLRIQGGAQVIAAAVDLFLAEQGDGATARFFDEEVGVGVFGAARRRTGVQRAGKGRLQLFVRQPLVVSHLAQHPIPPTDRGLGIAFGVIVGRPLGQGRQEGRLVRRQLIQRLAEIVVGRRGHAIGAIAQVDLVQIQLEDLLLAQRRFKTAGEDGFLELAVQTGLAGQQDVLGHLLGDGRAAFQATTGQHVEDVLEHGPADAGHVDAAVAEEVLVLGRQEGVNDRLRHLVVGDVDTALVRELADQSAVLGIDARRRRRTIVRQLGGVRHVVQDPGGVDRHHHTGHGDGAQQGHARHDEPAFGYLHHELRKTRPMIRRLSRVARRAKRNCTYPLSRSRRALSRCQSRSAEASRLSCSFLPLARAISSFALPASFRYSRTGTMVRPSR